MRRLIGTFATILACVILAGVLLGLYRWNRQNEAEKAAALREKAEQYEQEAVSERNAAESEAAKAVSEAAKAESEAAAPASSAAQAADETVPEEEQAPVTPAAGGAVVISCRGDDFISRSNPGKTYPEYLEEILSAYAEVLEYSVSCECLIGNVITCLIYMVKKYEDTVNQFLSELIKGFVCDAGIFSICNMEKTAFIFPFYVVRSANRLESCEFSVIIGDGILFYVPIMVTQFAHHV